jgi:hypothetical protein
MNDLVVVEKIAQWQKLKTLVLDSVSSPITKRVYNMALDEFYTWFQRAPPIRLHQGDCKRVEGIAGGTPPRLVVNHYPQVGHSQISGGGDR